MKVQCLILAGGLGTRMSQISPLPKALLPVGPKAFIEWQLEWLKLNGVDQVCLALAHGGQEIKKHIEAKKDSAFPELTYSFDGPNLLGTGGAIRQAAPLLDSDFLVSYGDSFLFVDAADLLKTHQAKALPLTTSIYMNSGAGDKSNVCLLEDGHFIYDKANPSAQMNYIDYGMSALNREQFLATAPVNSAYDLATYMTHVSRQGQAYAYRVKHMFCEIGSPAGYQNFCNLLQTHQFDLLKLRSNMGPF